MVSQTVKDDIAKVESAWKAWLPINNHRWWVAVAVAVVVGAALGKFIL